MSDKTILDEDRTRPVKGVFDLHIYRDGVEIEHYVDHNIIVHTARTAMAHLVGDCDPDKQITKFGVGTGTDAASMDDTTLQDAFIKELDGHEYPDDEPYNVRFNFSLTTAEANDMAITEFGLLCDDETMFAHKVRSVITKESDLSLSGTWTILF